MPTLSNTDLEQLFDQPVIVTPITTAPADGALVYWNANNEGFIVQPLHTAADRRALAASVERVRVRMTGMEDK